MRITRFEQITSTNDEARNPRYTHGDIITADAYRGKTIDVKGIVDCFDGDYQIKVMDDNYITVH